MNQAFPISKPVVWTGRVMKALLVLFLFVDSIMKIIKHPVYVKDSMELGLPANSVRPLGIYLFIATVLFILPRTAIVGIQLLVSYLGGAVAITFLTSKAEPSSIFPIMFAMFICIAEYLINLQFRNHLKIKI